MELPLRNGYAPTVGFFAVSVFALCWFCAAIFDPDWVYGVNMISDLGVSEDPVVASLFFIGCVAAGAMFSVFGYLAWKSVRTMPNAVPYLLCIPAGICLMCIGFFREGTPLHVPSALSLMVFAVLAILVSIVMEHRKGSRFMPALYIIMLAVSGLSFLGSKALAEANAIVCLMIWMVTVCTPVDELLEQLVPAKKE